MNRIVSCKSQKRKRRSEKEPVGQIPKHIVGNTMCSTHPLGNIVVLAVFVLLFGCCVSKRSLKFVDPFTMFALYFHISLVGFVTK